MSDEKNLESRVTLAFHVFLADIVTLSFISHLVFPSVLSFEESKEVKKYFYKGKSEKERMCGRNLKELGRKYKPRFLPEVGLFKTFFWILCTLSQCKEIMNQSSVVFKVK